VPTRPGFDLVSLRKETKARLAELKGSGSFDDVVSDLLAARDAASGAAHERPWSPEKQVALAELAARRWALARERGRIEELGPRLVVLRTGLARRGGLRVTFP
jgi:hypothetical protein